MKIKWRLVAICLIFLSTLFFIIILLGGLTGGIYLSKFTFDEPVKEITKKEDIKFTVYGYCIDSDCKKKELSHNFDKLPNIDELVPANLLSGLPNIPNPGIPNVPTPKVPDVPNVPNVPDVPNVPNVPNVPDVPKGPFKKRQIDPNQINEFSKALLGELSTGLNNFTPKSPTVNFSGFFSIPLIVASILNTIALILLLLNRKPLLNYIAIFFVFVSFLLNLLSFIFTLLLFSFVFNLIDFIPGIGIYKTGNAIYLSGFSVAFLFIAFCILSVQNCCKVRETSK